MKVVDFYKLPRAIQDRFVGSVMSGFPPAPTAAIRGTTRAKGVWLAIGGACFLALIVIARVGFGSLDSPLSIQSAKALVVYLALVFGGAFGWVQAFARVVRDGALPYKAGVYLFPACVIDARDDRFRVYDTRDLAGVEAQGASLRVVFKGSTSFVFPIGDAAHASQLVADVRSARDRAMRAHATDDPKELVAVDPLHTPRFSSPVGPRDPYEMRRPPWGRLGPAIAAAVAIAIAPAVWTLRNRGSDDRMYARATHVNDAASYARYLAHGDRYKGEVADLLLPRAELREAERVGTVDALLAYKKSHPGSKIPNEVAASIRRAMLGELAKAKQPETRAALEAFARRYPEHGVQPELSAALHAVYARELDAYKKKAPKKDPAATAFIERLFAHAEQHGPRVEVRFRRKAAITLERADQAILKMPTFMGVITYPSRFFDDKHASSREAALAQTLVAQFGSGLASDLFEIHTGPLVADAELPEAKVPTLFVTHVAEWSGHTYTSTRPRGGYVGLQFNFEATFVIPRDPKPYTLKTEVFKHAATYVLNEPAEPMLATGQAEEKVYETMSQGAFEEFAKRLLSGFFMPAKLAPLH